MIDRMKSNGREYLAKPHTVCVVMSYHPYNDRPVPIAVFADQSVANQYITSQNNRTYLSLVNAPFEPGYDELVNPGAYWEVKFNDNGSLIPVDRGVPPYSRSTKFARKVEPTTTPIHYRILEKGFGPTSANRGELIMTVWAKDADEAVRIAEARRQEYVNLTKSMHRP